MNIIVAHVKKDLVPLRGLIIAMAALLGLTLLGRFLNTTGAVRMSGGNFGALQFLLMLILVVRAIHLDTLVEPEAFWKTRPITRRQLLLAKASLIFGALAALAIIGLPWPGLDGVLTNAMVLSGFAAFASVTSSFSAMFRLFIRFVLIGILIWFIFGILGAIAAKVTMHFLQWPAFWQAPFSAEGFGMLRNAIVATAYVAVVVFQYLTLKTGMSERAIMLITVGALVMSGKIEVG